MSDNPYRSPTGQSNADNVRNVTVQSRLRPIFRIAAIIASPAAIFGFVFGYGYPISSLATRADYVVQGAITGLIFGLLVAGIVFALGALAEFVFKI